MKRLWTVAAILAALMICACGADEEPYVDPTEGFVESEMELTRRMQEEAAGKESAEEPETQASDPEDGEPAENQDAYDAPETAAVNAQDIMDKITASVTLPEMYVADDAYILNNYGIDPAELDSYAIEEALEVTLADKVIILDPAEGADRSALIEKLENFRQNKIAEMEDYLPELVDVISAASVKESGDLIYMVISSEADKIEAVIEGNIGR